ncbi:MAG TPA: 5-methyltetrahydrofolate--homocysteine methyltransferase, partial [Spirochaetia bacterium]|nr:5-methyltetrahydrofolate--homocysteine methyltransferase [Spirochaetia bacterium]
RGLPSGVCPEAWAVRHPDVVTAVHRDYLNAGADIIYTATFGGNAFKLAEYGEKDVVGINRTLAALARKAAGRGALVAGDIAPAGKFVEPFGELPFEEAVEKVKLQVRGLLEGGVDLFVIETMMDIQEARAALIAVRELTDAFTMVTMTIEKDGYTLNGTTPQAALVTLQSLGADAVGCNCSTGPAEMLPLIAAMKPYAHVPLAAKPNAGLPRLMDGTTVFDMGPEEFGSFGPRLLAAGANLVGGCCGTSPAHIRALAAEVKKMRAAAPGRTALSAVSSAREALIFKDNDPVHIVGERINPTGKKTLQAALTHGNYAEVIRLAREQREKGAALLDVNAGLPGIDERNVLTRMVNLLSVKSDLPLVLDSSRPEVQKRALRVYPGRALLNSISLEKEKMEDLLPAAAFFRPMLVVLPLSGAVIPETAAERIAVLEKIMEEVFRYGFTPEDLVVDGLVMALSSNPSAPAETLKTIAYCREVLHLKTIVGLSNVSFGMPARKLINAGFLLQAAAQGLTLAIANPNEASLLEAKLTADLLRKSDENAARFIKVYGDRTFAAGTGSTAAGPAAATQASSADPAVALEQAVLDGAGEGIEQIVDLALAAGKKPLSLINEHMIPAIMRVGDLFSQKKYFLPQLLSSAQTMERGVARLAPLVSAQALEKKGKVLMATVEGDIHDIGKNIVCLLLRNHGFEVVDLGKNVSAERIVSQARQDQPQVIGLSALMTTTMEKMREVVDLARREGLSIPFLLGGAVVNETFAASLGARYAADGVAAVAAVNGLLGSAK